MRCVSIGVLTHVKITNLHRDANSAINVCLGTLRLTVSPEKTVEKKVKHLGCVFQDTEKPKSRSILRKSTKSLGSDRSVRFSKRHVTQGSIARSYSEVRNSRTQSCAQIRGWNTARNLATRTIRSEKHGIWRNMSTSSMTRTRPRSSHLQKFGHYGHHLRRNLRREFAVDSGASMRTLSRKDLNLAKLETVRVSRNLTAVTTANGEVQTSEEAEVFVHNLDLFVTVQILGTTLAVLSLGRPCEEHGYSYEWASGHKPQWTKHGRKPNATRKSLSQDYRQVLPVLLQVHLPHRYRTTHLMIHRRLQQQLEVMIFLGHALYAEENLEMRYFDCRHRGAGSFGRVRNPCSKTQCKGRYWRPEGGDNFTFPVADGTGKLSTRSWEELVRSEDLREELQGNSETPQLTDERKDERWSQWWFLVDRREIHSSSPRRASNSAARAEGRNIPDFTAVHWRGQDKTYDLGRVARKAEKMIVGDWCESKFIGVMVRWRSSQYWMEEPPDGYVWSGRRLTTIQATTRPDHLWPEIWSATSKQLNERKSNNGLSRNQSSTMRASCGASIFLIRTIKEFKENILKRTEKSWNFQWKPLRFVSWRRSGIGKLVANPTKSEHQSIHAS